MIIPATNKRLSTNLLFSALLILSVIYFDASPNLIFAVFWTDLVIVFGFIFALNILDKNNQDELLKNFLILFVVINLAIWAVADVGSIIKTINSLEFLYILPTLLIKHLYSYRVGLENEKDKNLGLLRKDRVFAYNVLDAVSFFFFLSVFVRLDLIGVSGELGLMHVIVIAISQIASEIFVYYGGRPEDIRKIEKIRASRKAQENKTKSRYGESIEPGYYWGQYKKAFIFLFVTLGAVLVFAVFRYDPFFAPREGSVVQLNPATGQPLLEDAGPKYLLPISEEDNIYGNLEAKITIVSYLDFTNHFSARFHQVLMDIVEDYKEDVNLVYRSSISYRYHSSSYDQALAFNCVSQLSEAENYWNYSSILFDESEFSKDQLVVFAEGFGVEEEDLLECMNSKETIYKVMSDSANVWDTGGTGTPWTLILKPDGEAITLAGAKSYEEVEVEIIRALTTSNLPLPTQTGAQAD